MYNLEVNYNYIYCGCMYNVWDLDFFLLLMIFVYKLSSIMYFILIDIYFFF